MNRNEFIGCYNIFCKHFDRNEHFSPFKLSSAAIKIGVWITLAALNNLGWPLFELSSPHEKVSVWTGPNFTFAPMWYRIVEYLVINVCTLGRYYEYVYFYFRHLEFEPSGFETWSGILGQKNHVWHQMDKIIYEAVLMREKKDVCSMFFWSLM